MKKIFLLSLAALVCTPLFSQSEQTYKNLQVRKINLEQQKATYGLNDLELSKMEGSPYANSSFSVGNIYKGDEAVPAHFNTTRNLSFGGTLSMRYYLSK